jgi:hypothetical protein
MCELLVGLPDIIVRAVVDEGVTTALQIEIETRVVMPVRCASCGAPARIRARRGHFEYAVTTTLVSGLALVIFGWLIGHLWLGIWVEISLTMLGSGILIAGHWFNYHHHRHCSNSRHRHHPIVTEKTDKEKPVVETV